MKLSSADKSFIERRERLIRHWPVAGFGLLVLITVYVAWVWLKIPYLIDPWYVSESLMAGTLSESTRNVMVLMLPVVMCMFLVFAFVIVLNGFVVFSNERRLIRLLRAMEKGAAVSESG